MLWRALRARECMATRAHRAWHENVCEKAAHRFLDEDLDLLTSEMRRCTPEAVKLFLANACVFKCPLPGQSRCSSNGPFARPRAMGARVRVPCVVRSRGGRARVRPVRDGRDVRTTGAVPSRWRASTRPTRARWGMSARLGCSCWRASMRPTRVRRAAMSARARAVPSRWRASTRPTRAGWPRCPHGHELFPLAGGASTRPTRARWGRAIRAASSYWLASTRPPRAWWVLPGRTSGLPGAAGRALSSAREERARAVTARDVRGWRLR